MDLFYGNTFKEQIRALKKEIKAFAYSKYNYDYGRKRIYIAFGSENNVDNNILFVSNPFLKDSRPFSDRNYRKLFALIEEYKIFRSFITPNFIVPKDTVSTADIKSYSRLIDNLVEIIRPRLIVALGESSTFCFFRRKFILRDNHGTIIGKAGDIPVILSYAPEYYDARSEYEDPSFKKYIKETDWEFISAEYRKRVTNESEK